MRRLKLTMTAMALFLAGAVMAQKGPSYIGVEGGVSFPTGNWGKSAFISSTNGYVSSPAGFAGTGGFGGVSGAWFFSKHFGLGGLFRYGTYHTKNIGTLSAGYQDSFDVDEVATSSTSYKMWSVMPGVYYNQKICGRLSVTARALAGITHTQTPKISVDVTDSDIDDGTFVQESAGKSVFGFDGGIGLSYSILSFLSVNLRGDYFYSKPDFTIDNTERSNAAGRLIDSYHQPLAGVNVSLGVSYVFGGKK